MMVQGEMIEHLNKPCLRVSLRVKFAQRDKKCVLHDVARVLFREPVLPGRSPDKRKKDATVKGLELWFRHRDSRTGGGGFRRMFPPGPWRHHRLLPQVIGKKSLITYCHEDWSKRFDPLPGVDEGGDEQPLA